MSLGNLQRKILPFLIAALLTIAAFNVTFPESNPTISSPIEDHLAFIEACRERGEEIDLIIIGSSLAIAGVDTPLLQTMVREEGRRSFSALTVAALSFDAQGNNRLLREVLNAGVPGLDVVMMEQSLFPEGYPKPNQERTMPYLWLYADPREALASVDGILRSEAPVTEKIDRTRTVLGHFFSGAFAFNFIGVFTDRGSGGEAEGTNGGAGKEERFALNEAMAVWRGHVSGRDRAPGFTPERWKKYFAHVRKRMREAEAGPFDRATSPAILNFPFEMARKHEFDLILLFTPSAMVTDHVELYREWSERYAEEGVRSEVWYYNDFSDPGDLAYMQYEMRSDPIHLGRGSEPFTRELGERLVQFLDGASTQHGAVSTGPEDRDPS